MDDFNTIRLKRKVIEKFKVYSKKTSPSYSETLDYMISYFEDLGLSPFDTKFNPLLTSTVAVNKRTDAVIAILRNMEKTQLIPTREMLESLFQMEENEEELKTSEEIEASRTETEKLLSKYSNDIYYTKEELKTLKRDFRYVLSKLEFINKTFGKGYYQLNMPNERIEELKAKFL